jgi:hypothetical protein
MDNCGTRVALEIKPSTVFTSKNSKQYPVVYIGQ